MMIRLPNTKDLKIGTYDFFFLENFNPLNFQGYVVYR